MKDERETRGAGATAPPRRPRRGLIHLLMAAFALLTSVYFLAWLLIALRAPLPGSGAPEWPPPPKLADLPEVFSQLYRTGGPEDAFPDPAEEPAPWIGVVPDAPGRSPGGSPAPEPEPADGGGKRLSPPPRLKLIPSLAGSPLKTAAFLEASDAPPKPPSTLPKELRGGGTGLAVSPPRAPRRKFRKCRPGEKPVREDPCIADASHAWVKWPVGSLHPNAFTLPPEELAKLRDPGPYPENIIDEEEEYRPRTPPVVLTMEDVEALFEAVTGIADGQALRGRKAYAQLVEARENSVGAAKCPLCESEARIVGDRGSYYGERMKLR